MANDRPRANRAPPAPADPPAVGHSAPAGAANPTRDRLDQVLDARLAFAQAQGMLAEIAGCTPSRASEVLLHVGAQLGFDSAEGVAEFFLAAAAANPGSPDTLEFTRRAATAAPETGTAAVPAEPNASPDEADADGFATLIAGGRGVAVRGELDIATAPLLAAAFAEYPAAAVPGQIMLLDLHGMTFIDVAGVRALSQIHTQASSFGSHLRVKPPLRPFTIWMLQFAVRSGWLPPLFADGAPWLR